MLLHFICRKTNWMTWEQRATRRDFCILFISISVDHCSRLTDSCLLYILSIKCILRQLMKRWEQLIF